MKKIRLLPMVVLMAFVCMLVGCSKEKDNKIEIGSAQRVSIYYGVSSYAMFTKEEEIISTLKDCFTSLQFKETEEKIDVLTALSIYFFENEDADETEEKNVVLVCVDENGVFQLNGSPQSLKVSSGNFNYSDIMAIYEAGKDG